MQSFTDLTNCEREPIHAPGCIQPYGFLFVLDPDSWRVVAASSNTRDLFWREATALLGSTIDEVLGTGVAATLERAVQHPEVAARALYAGEIVVDSVSPAQRYVLLAHRVGGELVLEGEPASVLAPLQVEDDLQVFLSRSASTESAEELMQRAVVEVRRITGFDRCLLYRFDPDWNGNVVAEDRNEVLPSYLHHRFPASDIPRQARELYRRNRVRLIASNDYRPVPIVSHSSRASAPPLDLSLSVLRSVSPIHLEYMRNMGTGSSMSISVLQGDHLWGLISCHSRDPRFVSYAVRALGDLVGQVLSQQLTAREHVRLLQHRVELTSSVLALLSGIAARGSVAAGLQDDRVMRLALATGAAWVQGDTVRRFGDVPADDELFKLTRWLREQNTSTLASAAMAKEYPAAEEWAPGVCGVLAISLPPAGSWLMWFRPELIQVIAWGGTPEKPAGVGEPGLLHPRKSFDTWRETVRGQSMPWEPAVLAAVGELARGVETIFSAPPA